MIVFAGTSADAVWTAAARRIYREGHIQEGRDQPTRELLHTAFSIADPRQRVVFARPINPAFAIAEVLWILAGANRWEFLHFWNPRIRRYSDDQATLRGAYGFRLGARLPLSRRVESVLRDGSPTGPNQLREAFEALRQTPSSRQVVLQIWDAARDLPDPNPRSRDIPCNVTSHLLDRDGQLHWLQVIRSNDLIWGTPYNFVQFTTIQEIVAGWLGINLGPYEQVSDSLHIYERHWALRDSLTKQAETFPTNSADARIGDYREWERVCGGLVEWAVDLTARSTETEIVVHYENVRRALPAAYREWAELLAAEALRRRNHRVAADRLIGEAGAFWEQSWSAWANVAASQPGREP